MWQIFNYPVILQLSYKLYNTSLEMNIVETMKYWYDNKDIFPINPFLQTDSITAVFLLILERLPNKLELLEEQSKNNRIKK